MTQKTSSLYWAFALSIIAVGAAGVGIASKFISVWEALYAILAAGWILLLVVSVYRGSKEPGHPNEDDLMPPGAW
jgi:hypothetical protein